MAQYIDKSALVAEIERRIKTNKECMLGLRNLDYYQGKVDALNDTISFIDALEVKEANLEKELTIAMPHRHSWSGDGSTMLYTEEQMKDFAKHFFELGLKAQKGEEV